jgi:hypothetical protein
MIKECHKGMTGDFPRHYKLASLRRIGNLAPRFPREERAAPPIAPGCINDDMLFIVWTIELAPLQQHTTANGENQKTRHRERKSMDMGKNSGGTLCMNMFELSASPLFLRTGRWISQRV